MNTRARGDDMKYGDEEMYSGAYDEQGYGAPNSNEQSEIEQLLMENERLKEENARLKAYLSRKGYRAGSYDNYEDGGARYDGGSSRVKRGQMASEDRRLRDDKARMRDYMNRMVGEEYE